MGSVSTHPTIATPCDTARTLRVQTFMAEQLEPTADEIWSRAGFIYTPEETIDLWPKTDEEWAEVAAYADQLIELAAILETEPYSADAEVWIEYSRGLATAAQGLKDNAEAQAREPLFNSGGYIYNVCRACHQAYMDVDGFNPPQGPDQ